MKSKAEFIQNAKEFIQKSNSENLLLLVPTTYGRLSSCQLKNLIEKINRNKEKIEGDE